MSRLHDISWTDKKEQAPAMQNAGQPGWMDVLNISRKNNDSVGLKQTFLQSYSALKSTNIHSVELSEDESCRDGNTSVLYLKPLWSKALRAKAQLTACCQPPVQCLPSHDTFFHRWRTFINRLRDLWGSYRIHDLAVHRILCRGTEPSLLSDESFSTTGPLLVHKDDSSLVQVFWFASC